MDSTLGRLRVCVRVLLRCGRHKMAEQKKAHIHRPQIDIALAQQMAWAQFFRALFGDGDALAIFYDSR